MLKRIAESYCRLILALIAPPLNHCLAETPAFPGAEGLGRFATGGRGGMFIM